MLIFRTRIFGIAVFAILALYWGMNTGAVHARTLDVNVFATALAKKSVPHAVRQFYASRKYKPIWVGSKNNLRSKTLISALDSSWEHGLPATRYGSARLKDALKKRNGNRNAAVEIMATRIFLKYAHDLSSGILEPSKIDKNLSISRPRRSELVLLQAVSKGSPRRFFDSLAPVHPDYARLLTEKQRLENILANGGFGAKSPVARMQFRDSNYDVVALRMRLTRMGYGRLGERKRFDGKLVKAIRQFQTEHGLNVTGIADTITIGLINVSDRTRLKQVLVNLERERWLNRNRGKRHIIVNLADFSFNLYDDNKVSFTSRAVIGIASRHRTPEFHDQMTHLVINPTWNVPRSIAAQEYLPLLKEDAGFLAARQMKLLSGSGAEVNPNLVDFSKFSASNFPYSIKQLPSPGNAMGKVKFIFPNRFNIYLHDTPAKKLFSRRVRAFSHGCVRVHKPFDFAEKLLEKQFKSPRAVFDSWLRTRGERYVNLQKPVPIFIEYRTVFFDEYANINYRDDIYGRDRKVFNALHRAGVGLYAAQG